MQVKQFYDKGLAHASYAILSEGEMVIIDPERDPFQYIEYAKENKAQITGIIETHLHADFVSAHWELSQVTKAKIYVSRIAGAEYDHTPLDEGSTIFLGKLRLICINTPGHSPESISILAVDEDERTRAVFTGDTLFAGDVGRPDLREAGGEYSRHELAEVLFYSLNKKLLKLPDETIVYPAHGPGSLCGKNLGPELQSSIGAEKKNNPALQLSEIIDFIEYLLKDQPFVPAYFPYNVSVNRKGSAGFKESIAKVRRGKSLSSVSGNAIVVDTRPNEQFQQGHVKGAFNIQLHKSFETWLGTIVLPDEKFYLLSENPEELELAIRKTAKIGYEQNIIEALMISESAEANNPLNKTLFDKHTHEFTIVDVRNKSEHAQQLLFKNSINIPLHELRNRSGEIPQDKPVVVHCAAGTRSAIGASILKKEFSMEVYDLGEFVKNYPPIKF